MHTKGEIFFKQTVFAYAALLLLVALACGCGPRRPETVQIRGRITLNGGDWPVPGMIIFTPVEPAEGFPRRAGRGVFDPQGRFQVTTYVKGDGLMPGKYRATVLCGEPIVDMDTPAKSFVPDRYQNSAQSGLELIVLPGSGHMEVEYDIPAE
ncbi:MAG: hypothetical protein GX594_10430 [Pirellulaceae bacterium]|nr:hypothetical protein [Pirellulaceae bacterium]